MDRVEASNQYLFIIRDKDRDMGGNVEVADKCIFYFFFPGGMRDQKLNPNAVLTTSLYTVQYNTTRRLPSSLNVD